MTELQDTTSGDVINTPDRRVRVFVSSTLAELADERRAARAAVARMHLTPVMFELGARPHPPRELYRAYLSQSDVFVGIYWQRYGWTAPGEDVSGLEDEYRLSGDRPKLIYVKAPAPDREPQLEDLLSRIRDDDQVSYKAFHDGPELQELLTDDLAVLLTERFASSGAESAVDLRPSRLPVPPTPIVGRDDDLDTLRGLVARPGVRLVTVVGPGGIGKTRLALELASTLPPSQLDGVWYVDLAAVSDPDRVTAAIAAVLGLHSEGSRLVLDVLADRLSGRHVLLVLDNFEQVLPAARDLAALLRALPGLTLLVTSRSVLRLRGEHVFPLAPLATPPGVESPLEEVAASPAVRLFVERAEEVRPDFELTSANAGAVAEVCRRLDGVPLAIELAAARTRLLPPAALLERLGNRLDLPSDEVDVPERQRTLRATIDWSHSLLDEHERALFARLSVFARGWTLEAAEAVGGDLDVLETLSSLVAQSLVSPDESADIEPRFRMLDTVREYARQRLAERGEEAASSARLAAYLRSLSGRAGEGLRGSDNRLWVGRLDAEQDNLRAALRRAIADDDAELVVRIAAPLYSYWWTRSLLPELLDLAERTAALPSAAKLPADARVLLAWSRGAGRIACGIWDEAAPLLRDVIADARPLGDDRLLALALTSLAITLPYEGPRGEGRALLEEGVGLFRRVGDDWGIAFSLLPLGQMALRDGDVPTAAAVHEESLAAAERIDNAHLRAQVLNALGLDALLTGDVQRARGHLVAGAEVHRRLLDQEGIAYCLDAFSGVALALGRPGAATRLSAAAARLREVIGIVVWPLLGPLAEAMVAGLKAAAGEELFAREWAAGAGMRPGDALTYALEATAPTGNG